MANSLTEKEIVGIKKMRELNQEFLQSGKGSNSVRDFLAKANENENLLKTYLRGRKYRAQHAWETLKRKAEVRFDEYPDVFTPEVPEIFFMLQKRGILGLLKERDSQGRRILAFNAGAWDPSEFSYNDLLACGVHVIEEILKNEDAMTKGLVVLQNCDGMGWRHAKQYTLPAMLKCLNIFWYASPLLLKGLYLMNVPSYLTFVVKIIEPFLAKKMKERLHISTKSKNNSFDSLHQEFSPEILPKFLGGDLTTTEAFEPLFQDSI